MITVSPRASFAFLHVERCHARFLATTLLAILFAQVPVPQAMAEASYVDSKAIRERFDSITAEDMEMLRGKKIFLASRSFGLNLFKGLGQLAKADPKYQFLSSYERFDVNKAGGDMAVVPPDIFDSKKFVHILATYYPLTKRLEEVQRALTEAPHEFGKKVDAVVIFYHTSKPEIFEPYTQAMSEWQRQFPDVRFIFVTSGFGGPKYAAANDQSFAFGERIRKELRGKVPIYDMGAILSDDSRVGNFYCPEYSADPAEVHPNLPAGESMMAKGFLLVLKEAFNQPPAAPAISAGSVSDVPGSKTETLPPTHPDARAVRAILDANGLTQKTVEGVSVVEKGRVVALYLQEGGMATLPDEIGTLTALRKLHIYGDRNLPLPRLEKVSPEIGRCTQLEEVLLNQNELTTLPIEIARLQKLRNLSIADNRLLNLPAEVTAWAQKFDPKGLADQKSGNP